MSATRRMHVGALLLAGYGMALALIAFWPVHVDRPAMGFLRALARAVPLLTYDVVEFTANVLLFVPLGVLLAIAMPRRRAWAVPIALVVTAVIEMGQALFLDDRTASLGDVVANTLGAAVGLAIVLMVDRRTSVAVVVADRVARSGDGKGVERDR
jgi:hypothetical protein